MKRKITSLLLIILIVFSMVPIHSFAATPVLYLTYNGNRVDSGGSIHYTGSRTSFRLNFGMSGFNLYMNGLFYSWTENNYMDISLDKPATQIVFRAEHSSDMNEITVNFYKNTVVDPNASLAYQSYKVYVKEANKEGQVITIGQEFGYDGVTDTGIDKTEFGNYLNNKGITEGNITASGYIYVHVFVNNEHVGDYNTNTGAKIPGSGNGNGLDNLYTADENGQKYNWGSVEYELRQRGDWSYSYYYVPPVQSDPGFQIWHDNINKTDGSIEVDSTPYFVDLKDKSTNATSWKWYIKTPAHSDYTYFSSEQNPSNVAVWKEGLTYFKQEVNGGKTITHTINANLKPIIQPGKGQITVIQMNSAANTPIIGGTKTISDVDLNKEITIHNTEIAAPGGGTYDGANKSYTAEYPPVSGKLNGATGQTVTLTETNNKAYIYFYYLFPESTPTPTPTPTPPPTAAKPKLGIAADKTSVMVGDTYTIIDKSRPGEGASKIVSWIVNIRKYDLDESHEEILLINTTISSPETFFKQYRQTKPGLHYYTLVSVTDDKGGTDSFARDVCVKVEAPPARPPVAAIVNSPKVVMGEDTSILSASTDPDNDIVKYDWTLDNASPALKDTGGTVSFSVVGTYTITLKVVDSTGLSDTATSTIEVTPPYPTAIITFTGRQKENYKITSNSESSYSPKKYPIDTSKTVWTLEAISGNSTSDIKYHPGLTGITKKDFLVKKKGTIRVGLTVTNTAGYSDTTYIDIDIAENLPPIADLVVPKTTLREYRTPEGLAYGKVLVTDTSYSPDNDKIIYRKFYRTYDANNDKQFTEGRILIYEGTGKSYEDIYYSNEGVGLCLYDVYVEEDLLEKDAYGNYINTIIEFINPATDVKTANTFIY